MWSVQTNKGDKQMKTIYKEPRATKPEVNEVEAVVKLNSRTERPPLKWLTVEFWTPIENMNSSLSNQNLKDIGGNVFKALRNGFKGGSSNNMSQLSELMINN